MSNWTHVAAIFRCDALKDWDENPDETLDESIERIFGKFFPSYPDNLDDEEAWNKRWEIMRDAEAHPDEYIPFGSEEGLKISIWENPDPSCAAHYTISVFGDLRDHHDNELIKKWFLESCQKVSLLRQAVCTSYNEWYGIETWTYNKDSL